MPRSSDSVPPRHALPRTPPYSPNPRHRAPTVTYPHAAEALRQRRHERQRLLKRLGVTGDDRAIVVVCPLPRLTISHSQACAASSQSWRRPCFIRRSFLHPDTLGPCRGNPRPAAPPRLGGRGSPRRLVTSADGHATAARGPRHTLSCRTAQHMQPTRSHAATGPHANYSRGTPRRTGTGRCEAASSRATVNLFEVPKWACWLGSVNRSWMYLCWCLEGMGMPFRCDVCSHGR